MQKLIAFFCAIALMTAMMVPAFASGSISGLETTLVTVATEEKKVESWKIVIVDTNSVKISNAAVKEVVDTVNDPQISMTMLEALEKLDNASLSEEQLAELAEYDFVTDFNAIVLKDGRNYYFNINGSAINAKAQIKIDALQGETDLSNYLIMLINPDNGEIAFLELDANAFNAATGEITVEYPFLGVFALIQK